MHARSRSRLKHGRRSPLTRYHPRPPFPLQQQRRPGIEARMRPRPPYRAPAYLAAGKLAGKVSLVTGGDSGIGRAVSVLYAREGADVAILFLPSERGDAEETRRSVHEEGGRCLLLPGDITSPRFCERAVSRTVDELGRLDILVNNAAYESTQASLEDISVDQWDRTFRTNIHGYFFMARAALKHLPSGGAIINCGSITGLRGNKHLIDYSATKGAIHAFTKALAQNLAPRRIRVNCVAPGPVWTPFIVSDKSPRAASEHGALQPYGRLAQPEEIAPAFVFFASEADSCYITGEVLTLPGGETTAA